MSYILCVVLLKQKYYAGIVIHKHKNVFLILQNVSVGGIALLCYTVYEESIVKEAFSHLFSTQSTFNTVILCVNSQRI